MPTITRRSLVATLASGVSAALVHDASAATTLSGVPMAAPASHAADSAVSGVTHGLAAHLRLSCNLYSFNAALRSGAMSLKQAITYCAELGFDAVDPTGYYFSSYPAPPSDAEIFGVKQHAFLLGLDISGTGVRNDFAVPDRAKREADVAHVRRWIEVAAKLGAPVLRVFAGLEHVGAPDRATTMGWVVDGIQACVEEGERRGVMIVYQNHWDALRTADEALELRQRIPSRWFGLNVDIGSLRSADPYAEIATLAPHAYTWQLKELVYPNDRPQPTDVARVLRIIREARYRGYVPIETLGEGDPKQKVRAFLARVREALER